MRIKGKSVQLFLPVFLKYYSPATSVSNTSTTTIYNILTTYAELGVKKNKVSVSDLVSRAGYSRTTFYSYFADVKEVTTFLEEMISYHMYTNSEVYFNCFMGALDKEEEKEVIAAIGDFSPFIHSLLHQSPGYKERYEQDFRRSFDKIAYAETIPEESRPVLANAVSAALVYLINEYLKGSELVSLRSAMDCAKIIFQSITTPLK